LAFISNMSFSPVNRHEAELAAAAAQPLPDDDDDLIE
jgi:cbb3-type cytochrome oxidase subunit 3